MTPKQRAAKERMLEGWDENVLPVANDGMMQERMEDLRAALAEQPAEQEPRHRPCSSRDWKGYGMTNEEIIEAAREAGFTASNRFSLLIVRHSNGSWVDVSEELTRFAELIAAREREACAKVCDEIYYQHLGPEYGEVRYGIAACSTAIRARGNT